MRHFLVRLALCLSLTPIVMILAMISYQSGHDTAERRATRSFAGWDCTIKHTELQRRYAGPLPLFLDIEVCDQWTRPRE